MERNSLIRLGGLSAMVGGVAFLAEVLALITFLLGSEALSFLAFPLAFIAIPVGFVLYGVATLQAKVLPRWCGLGLIIIPPLTQMFIGDPAWILFGLLWVALSYALWSQRVASTERPSSPA